MIKDYVTAEERLTFEPGFPPYEFYINKCAGCGADYRCTYKELEDMSKDANSSIWYCSKSCYRDNH